MPESTEPDWKWLAIRALHDLRSAGIDIYHMDHVTAEIICEVDRHARELDPHLPER